jgi:hypothetical protein
VDSLPVSIELCPELVQFYSFLKTWIADSLPPKAGQSTVVFYDLGSHCCPSGVCHQTVLQGDPDSPGVVLRTVHHPSPDSLALHREGISCLFLWGFVSSVSQRCSGVPNTLRGMSCYRLARVSLASCVSLLLGLWIEPRTKVFKRNLRLPFTPIWSPFLVLQFISKLVKDHSTLIIPWSTKATWSMVLAKPLFFDGTNYPY